MSDIESPAQTRIRPSDAIAPRALRLAVSCVVVVGLAACGSGQSSAKADRLMPDVVGQQLDVALSDIKRAGFADEVEVLGGGTFGVVVESNWQVCGQLPGPGQVMTEQPRLTVDRSCGSDSTEPEPTSTPTDAPAVPAITEASPQSTTATESGQADYTYAGPQYEIVAHDTLGNGLDEYFVLIDKLDYSTDLYKDQIKMIISDLARTKGTAKLSVDVVTDIEIALLESFPTSEAFYAEHGDKYVNKVVLPKEKTNWVTSFTGGYDYDLSQLSDSDNAYEIIWFPYGSADIEKWKPAST